MPDRKRQQVGGEKLTIFPFLSLIGPYVLIGFFALMSLFNFNFKGVIYIIGVMILLLLASLAVFENKAEAEVKSSLVAQEKLVCTIFGTTNPYFKNVPQIQLLAN